MSGSTVLRPVSVIAEADARRRVGAVGDRRAADHDDAGVGGRAVHGVDDAGTDRVEDLGRAQRHAGGEAPPAPIVTGTPFTVS